MFLSHYDEILEVGHKQVSASSSVDLKLPAVFIRLNDNRTLQMHPDEALRLIERLRAAITNSGWVDTSR